MKQFHIWMRSFADIQAFVALSSKQSFDITVGTDDQDISAKSLMAMLGLNLRRPVTVRMNCDEAEFVRFQHDAARFLA